MTSAEKEKERKKKARLVKSTTERSVYSDTRRCQNRLFFGQQRTENLTT